MLSVNPISMLSPGGTVTQSKFCVQQAAPQQPHRAVVALGLHGLSTGRLTMEEAN